jgi:hypothetical protein
LDASRGKLAKVVGADILVPTAEECEMHGVKHSVRNALQFFTFFGEKIDMQRCQHDKLIAACVLTTP